MVLIISLPQHMAGFSVSKNQGQGPCGKHIVYYPTALAHEATHGRFYAFETVCECPTGYLIHTAPDGAHCKAVDTAEAIFELYDALHGEEHVIQDENGAFRCKRLAD